MRIAMFTETFLPGTDGIVTRLCATLKHLEEDGHEVLLFAPDGGLKQFGNTRVVGMPTWRFFLYPEKRFAFPVPQIRKLLVDFRPDLIHVVNPAFLGLGGIYYAKRLRVPLVASYHTNVPAYARHYHLEWLEPSLWWYFRTLHNKAAINLCTSKATLQVLESQRFQRLALWERGVDLSKFSASRRSEAMRERLAPGVGQTGKILLYVGRLAAEKGIQKLRQTLDSLENVHLAIVGDGPYRSELEHVFTGSRTTFLGYLHGEELAQAYASSDGFVFPSTTETLGLVLFEAMASGLPVMAADSPPTREVLNGGRAGFIFNPGNASSVLETVQKLLFDEGARSQTASHAYELVADLDWKTPTRQLISHYQQVLAGDVVMAREAAGPARS